MVTTLQWVNELRMTAKLQGKRFLCLDERYCCLGVGAEMCFRFEVMNTQLGAIKRYIVGDRLISGTTNAFLSDLPLEMTHRLYPDNIQVAYNGSMVQLTHLNDHKGLTFAEIANLVEATWYACQPAKEKE